jgi:hypothetical protein
LAFSAAATCVKLVVELGGAHLLHDVGVLRLVDGEEGAAVRALDLVRAVVGVMWVMSISKGAGSDPAGGAAPSNAPPATAT